LIAAALKVAAVAAALFAALPLVAYFAQGSLIFHPRPLPAERSADVARRFASVQEVFIQAKDGAKLHAWYLRPGSPLVIYFGGNAEEVSWMIEETANAPGASWLLVDYRGYGLSEGSPGERALVSDAIEWYDYAMKLPGADPKRTFAFGRSLGSGVAVALAAERPLAGVILATPYDSLVAVAKRYYWYLPVDLLLKHRFDSIALAPMRKEPLLCLIAERDEVIPPMHAERLFDAWGGAKRKVVLAEAGHNSIHAHPGYWPPIREFLAQKVN